MGHPLTSKSVANLENCYVTLNIFTSFDIALCKSAKRTMPSTFHENVQISNMCKYRFIVILNRKVLLQMLGLTIQKNVFRNSLLNAMYRILLAEICGWCITIFDFHLCSKRKQYCCCKESFHIKYTSFTVYLSLQVCYWVIYMSFVVLLYWLDFIL